LITAVTRRVALEVARARRRTEPLWEDASESPRESGLSADVQQLFQDLARFQGLLTRAQAQAVHLSAQGVGPRKGAAMLGISVTAFRERLLRAIRRLRGEAGRESTRTAVRTDLPHDVARRHPQWAKALRLHEWGLSYRRIGQALGLSREAARSLLKRLRRPR
jgi:DNA-directed RNA polymerase specialized sigma24 family protein